MRVAFSDPQGRRLWRAAPYGGPLALFAFACFGPFDGSTAVFLAVLAAALFHFVGILPLRQRRMRPCELVTGPGFIELRKAGTRSQRIDARCIGGATTARTDNGVRFTLAHTKRDQPITIEVATDADANAIRHALGIGHGGFGTVGWRTVPSPSAKAGFWGRLITFLIGMLIAGLGLFVSHEVAGITALLTGQVAMITAFLGLICAFAKKSQPSVVMAAEGLRLQTKLGPFTLPYDHVLGIEPMRGTLRFHVPPPYHFLDVDASASAVVDSDLGPVDKSALIEQIMSASARARGLGVSKNDVTGRVDVLRRNGESARSWLSRLDMAGRMLETSTAGYRGHTLDTDDLWTLLEDPEAEADLRAAAARVLRHSPKPETRQRIDAAVAAVRDDATNRRLRIAIRDDVDNASHELTALDAQENLQLRAMQPR